MFYTNNPIIIKDFSLIFPHKICFEGFSMQIYPASRIAIIGRNGSGKSSLLQMVKDSLAENITYGYVPQLVEDHKDLSGGQRFNKALTDALAEHPDVLMLDEPTNHLDLRNRKSLMRMLQNFPGTLLMVTHDVELLRNIADIFWHIDQGKIRVFAGNYDDYIADIKAKRFTLEQELSSLARQKQDVHQALMKEQVRAKNSKAQGKKNIQQRKWPTITSHTKAGRAEETSGRKKSEIHQKKQEALDRLSELRLPEAILPKFSLNSVGSGGRALVTVTSGSVSYDQPVLENISFSVNGGDRVAIIGDNGSGKSTLIKAIMGCNHLSLGGDWYVPNSKDIGYLDQHYGTLEPNHTIIETMQDLRPDWSLMEIRLHLNDFLFRKNEEVMAEVSTLSGGEKCRLSLAQIAAKPPKLLILDEVTNNLDLETRDHVIQVLQSFPGAMIVISHDEDFLNQIGIDRYYDMSLFSAGKR